MRPVSRGSTRIVRLPLFQSSATRPDCPGFAKLAASAESAACSASSPWQMVSTHHFRMSPTADWPASMP
jgi:hypothetical protein